MTIPEPANPRWMNLELHTGPVSAGEGLRAGVWGGGGGLGHRERLLKGLEGGERSCQGERALRGGGGTGRGPPGLRTPPAYSGP